MATTDSARPTADDAAPETGTADGFVAPFVPLLLLETLRDMDRPEELLEGEDVTTSMPRRFGLNDVVYMQIHRFRDAVRRGRPQSTAEVENLIRLVIRRPDAEEIFEEAGRRVARHAWEKRSAAYRRAVRLLPGALALRSARRATRTLFRQIVGSGGVDVSRPPLAVRITDSPTATADPGGGACAFYAGVIAEIMHCYTGRRAEVQHPRCRARQAPECEWKVASG